MHKKVLFISPTPTHPTNAGNRLHIKSLVSFFKEQKWETHFLYLAYENYDEQAMRAYFGENNLLIVPQKKIHQNRKTLPYIFWKISVVLMRYLRKIQLITGSITKNQYLYNNEVDNYFSVFMKPVITELQKKNKYDAVVCEYVSMSKALTFFDKDVFKILDTIDIFTDRFKVYLELNLQPGWVSLYRDQEIKALKRADLVLAVKKNDAEIFSNMVKRKIILYNYIPNIKVLPAKIPENKLLYIASDNAINVASINLFIEKIFSLILNKNPAAKLIIGGSICEQLTINHPNIFLTGKIERLEEFYALGDVVINPENGGTGYKLKTLEALAYGMPLISTTAGAVGVAEPFKDHLFIADSPKDFADAVNELFHDPELLKTISVNAHQWIKEYKEKLTKELLENSPA